MILWTILTAVLVLTLLVVLTWALANVLRALQGIRTSLEKIAMGVKAISVETSPLPGEINGVAENLTRIGNGLSVVDSHLSASADSLPGAARNLGLIH